MAGLYAYGDTTPTVQFTYDALGRQVVRNEKRGTVTTYQYDGDNILTERQGSTTSSRYLFGTNRLLKYGEAPQLDGLGNMRQGIDTSSGQFTGLFDFDAFGNSLNGSSGAKSVYRWGAQSGYRTDIAGGDGGYVKVGCRYYDPLIGRFSSRDTEVSPYSVNSPVEAIGFQTLAAVQEQLTPEDVPASFVQTSIGSFSLQPVQGHNIMDGEHSQNAYAYCLGDPMNAVDPDGHNVVIIIVIIAFGLYDIFRYGKEIHDHGWSNRGPGT